MLRSSGGDVYSYFHKFAEVALHVLVCYAAYNICSIQYIQYIKFLLQAKHYTHVKGKIRNNFWLQNQKMHLQFSNLRQMPVIFPLGTTFQKCHDKTGYLNSCVCMLASTSQKQLLHSDCMHVRLLVLWVLLSIIPYACSPVKLL